MDRRVINVRGITHKGVIKKGFLGFLPEAKKVCKCICPTSGSNKDEPSQKSRRVEGSG
jgi:hypothetical protein